MKEMGTYTIEENLQIAKDVYQMRLAGSTAAFTAPGQFVNIQIDGFYLRRPISVCTWDAKSLTIIYKILGKGTAVMACMRPGQKLDLITGLGNGFTVAPALGKTAVLVGGGVGVPPLFGLAQALARAGKAPAVALGFASAQDVFYTRELEALGCAVYLATEDGSAGEQGFVTRILQDLPYDYYFACGPNPMLKAVYDVGEGKRAKGQLSFEERMGCGFGACMGCSCQTKQGAKRVCVEGPVFTSEEVLFT